MNSTTQSIDELGKLALAAASGTDHALIHSPFARAIAKVKAREEKTSLLREILGWALEQNAPRIDDLNYPKDVRQLVHDEFAKITEGLDEVVCDFELHEYRSQLRIACLGRIPVGPEHFEVDGVPRCVLYTGGLIQSQRFLRLLWEMKTFHPAPMYLLHLAYGIPAAAFLLCYTSNAQNKMFHRLAGCLQMNPQIKGVAAGSWWFDPSIATHSSYLSYLREGWEEKGAKFFFFQATASETRLATMNAPERQKLVSEGRYRPACYIAVWTRASLLSWASSDLAS